MAKRKKRRGTGNIIATRRVSGLGSLGRPGSFLGAFVPPVVGGGLTALASIGISSMAGKSLAAAAQANLAASAAYKAANPSAPQSIDQETGLLTDSSGKYYTAEGGVLKQTACPTAGMLVKWSPLLGLGAGLLGSAGMYMLIGSSAGLGAAAGTLGVGGALGFARLIEKSKASQTQGVYDRMMPAAFRGYRRMGAAVAERSTGALVLEPNADQGYNAYSGGEDVNLAGARGLGASMDVRAFGPSSF